MDVFEVCARISGYSRTKGEAKDLFAVWETCRILRLCGREEELRVFEETYLSREPQKYNNALRLSRKYHLDERTLYRRLAYVEKQYGIIRKSLD